MRKGDIEGLKSICEEGMYWGKQPKSRLHKLRRRDYRIPESRNDGDDESDGDDEEEVELSHSSASTAASRLSCSQQQSPFVKEFSELSSAPNDKESAFITLRSHGIADVRCIQRRNQGSHGGDDPEGI